MTAECPRASHSASQTLFSHPHHPEKCKKEWSSLLQIPRGVSLSTKHYWGWKPCKNMMDGLDLLSKNSQKHPFAPNSGFRGQPDMGRPLWARSQGVCLEPGQQPHTLILEGLSRQVRGDGHPQPCLRAGRLSLCRAWGQPKPKVKGGELGAPTSCYSQFSYPS